MSRRRDNNYKEIVLLCFHPRYSETLERPCIEQGTLHWNNTGGELSLWRLWRTGIFCAQQELLFKESYLEWQGAAELKLMQGR